MKKEIIKKKKQIIKDVRKFGLQDLTMIQLEDTINTGNEYMKLEGAPPLNLEEDDITWITALVVAVWFSFNGNFQEEWIKVVDKIVPNGVQYGE